MSDSIRIEAVAEYVPGATILQVLVDIGDTQALRPNVLRRGGVQLVYADKRGTVEIAFAARNACKDGHYRVNVNRPETVPSQVHVVAELTDGTRVRTTAPVIVRDLE